MSSLRLQAAIVRINILQMLRLIMRRHAHPREAMEKHDLYNMLQSLSHDGDQVLVIDLAAKFLNEMQGADQQPQTRNRSMTK